MYLSPINHTYPPFYSLNTTLSTYFHKYFWFFFWDSTYERKSESICLSESGLFCLSWWSLFVASVNGIIFFITFSNSSLFSFLLGYIHFTGVIHCDNSNSLILCIDVVTLPPSLHPLTSPSSPHLKQLQEVSSFYFVYVYEISSWKFPHCYILDSSLLMFLVFLSWICMCHLMNLFTSSNFFGGVFRFSIYKITSSRTETI
jgi:hypothetical protein